MTTKHIVFMILKAVLWKKEKIVAGKWTWKVVVWGNEEEGQGWGELIEVSQHQTWQSFRCWWHATVKWFWNCVFLQKQRGFKSFYKRFRATNRVILKLSGRKMPGEQVHFNSNNIFFHYSKIYRCRVNTQLNFNLFELVYKIIRSLTTD